MDVENRKIKINQTALSNQSNEFEYEQFNGMMATTKKHDWDGHCNLSKNGSRLLFQFDGYAFLDSVDATGQTHYWIGVSYWNKKHPDTLFEMELEPFYELIAMYLNDNNLPQFLEELRLIEFAGQVLEHMNQNAFGEVDAAPN